MNFDDIIEDLHNNHVGEHNVTRYRSYVAAALARLYFEKGELEILRANFTMENKAELKTIANIDRHFEATKEGNELIRIENRIKGGQRISDALEGLYWDLNRERKEAPRQET